MRSTATMQEIASAIGVNVSSARRRAQRQGWDYQSETCLGGTRRLYPIAGLPVDVRDALIARALTDQRPVEPSEPLLPAKSLGADTAQLAEWQRERLTARLALLNELDRLAAGGIGIDAASRRLCALAADGQLPERLQALIVVANAKSGHKRASNSLSPRTLYRWRTALNKEGQRALAPKKAEPVPPPAWALPLLKIYGQPQKPSLAACIAKLPAHLSEGVEPPSYDQAKRFLKKLSTTTRYAGRLGPRELKALRPYIIRDTSSLLPADVYTADGHTFDAEVQHPDHGQPFRPEVTGVIDVATRVCVGYSVGLAESTWTVADAFRHACESFGIPAIWYTDRGAGFRNEVMATLLDRLHVSQEFSLPYNSQSRGIGERSHQTLWVRAAQQLPTYIGAKMDPEAKHKVFRLTRAALKEGGRAKELIAWRDFVAYLEQVRNEYNATPHTGLPKRRDPESGELRHQTPLEAWQLGLTRAQEEGVAPVRVEQAEAADLFRPYKSGVKVARGMVRLFNNHYFHPDLEHYHGDLVEVGYDIHDAARVWVRDRQGRLIAIAEWDANKRDYFPKPVIEQARDRRYEGRAKRAERKLDEVNLEYARGQGVVLEHAGDDALTRDLAAPRCDRMVATLPIERGPVVSNEMHTRGAELLDHPTASRRLFGTDADKYEWLTAHPAEQTPDDSRWLDWYQTTQEFQLFYA